MKKEFVKAKIERCTPLSGKPSVRINDGVMKRLLLHGEIVDLFLLDNIETLEFKLCQIDNKNSESGYNILYNMKLDSISIDDIKKATDVIKNDNYPNLYEYINLLIEKTIEWAGYFERNKEYFDSKKKKKEFVKAKIEICTHRKGGEAVKINDSSPKRLLNFDKLRNIFITHKKDSNEFNVCQLKFDLSGYDIRYRIKCESTKIIERERVTQEIVDDGYADLAAYVKRFLYLTIIYEKSSI